MHRFSESFTTPSCQQHLTVIKKPKNTQNRKLLLLHGAGVAGELTWTFLAHYLNHWSEIYIPDFAGAGQASFTFDRQPTFADYLCQLDELMAAKEFKINDFDIAGYSFGGMVLEQWLRDQPFDGLVFLLEPAMLFSSNCQQILTKSKDYAQVAAALRKDPHNTAAYRKFLDSVSPQRSQADGADDLTIQRLQEQPQGFADALQALTVQLEEQYQYYSQWRAPWRGASFVGELSWPVMHQRHQQLAEQSNDWSYYSVANADHSLVFTRPRSIAQIMNDLASKGG